MATNDKKLLTLDHIQYIKDYIDDANSITNTRIENVENIVDAINEATESIQKTYDAEFDKLTKKIAQVEAAGNTDELATLNSELNSLKANTADKFNALATLQEQLYKVSSDLGNLTDGVTTGQIFSAGQLNEIINNTVINQTIVTEDMIAAPNAYAENLVALIGKFGKIKAANIEGGDITGHNIKSSNTVLGTDTPVWAINDEGDGWLAKGNIAWDTNGNVTFSDNIKISFDNVNGATDKLRDLMHEYDAELESYVNAAIKDNTATAASKEELNKVKSDIETELLEFEDALNGSIEALNISGIQEDIKKLSEDISVYADKDYENQIKDMQISIAGIDDAIAKAVAEGNAEIAAKLETYKASLTRDINVIEELYIDTKSSMLSIQSDIKNIQNSSLDPDAIAEVLETALINNTEITDGSISTPTLLAKKLVALTAKFGTIVASKISGTHIQGYTVSAPLEVKDADGNPVYKTTLDADGNPVYEYETVKDDNGQPILDADGNPVYVTEFDSEGNEVPVKIKETIALEDAAWALKSEGDGWLANGKISWTADGNMTVDGLTVLNSIENNTVANNKFKTLIADNIDVNNIKTIELETKSSETDKIYIKDNYIHCVNDDGNINLKISSDNVSADFIDSLSEGNMVDETVNSITPAAQPPTVFSNTIDNLKTVNMGTSSIVYRTNKEAHYSGNNNMINTDGDDLYCNRIGFVYSKSKLDIEVAVGIYNISSPSAYNPNTTKLLLTDKASYDYSDTGNIINNPGSYSGAKLPKWTIFGSNNITPCWGRPAPSTYVVGGNTNTNPTTSLSGGHLLIYKYDNESNDYIAYKTCNFETPWTDRLEPFKEPNTSNLLDWKYNTISDVIIEDDGIYAIEVCFEPNSIGVVDMNSTSDEVTYCVVCPFKTHIQQTLPNDFVEIGKDGIIVYNKKNTLSVGKGDVIISSKILDENGYDTFNFIGIKLNDEGIYLGTGSNEWCKLNVSKMYELGLFDE